MTELFFIGNLALQLPPVRACPDYHLQDHSQRIHQLYHGEEQMYDILRMSYMWIW